MHTVKPKVWLLPLFNGVAQHLLDVRIDEDWPTFYPIEGSLPHHTGNARQDCVETRPLRFDFFGKPGACVFSESSQREIRVNSEHAYGLSIDHNRYPEYFDWNERAVSPHPLSLRPNCFSTQRTCR